MYVCAGLASSPSRSPAVQWSPHSTVESHALSVLDAHACCRLDPAFVLHTAADAEGFPLTGGPLPLWSCTQGCSEDATPKVICMMESTAMLILSLSFPFGLSVILYFCNSGQFSYSASITGSPPDWRDKGEVDFGKCCKALCLTSKTASRAFSKRSISISISCLRFSQHLGHHACSRSVGQLTWQEIDAHTAHVQEMTEACSQQAPPAATNTAITDRMCSGNSGISRDS